MLPKKTDTPEISAKSMAKIAPRHLIAPCGLDCSRCVGCVEGSVAEHALAIAETMGNNFQTYADRLKTFNPAMNEYSSFRTLLDSLASPNCGGCRSENKTCLPSCNIANCVSERNIEFCFECTDFPDCKKTGLPDSLLERWKKNNNLMKNTGIENFIKGLAERPRYP
ncbi:DUF3795 domain-containing protein [Maridesulfovibrio ferrireducens]|uniref:DUF3795 domain-containing protein n=1 Tax=Maridesulfovibrio ferrireducens TaxID=246191 RepID=UPI001A19750D|nr:DUF3795 domain-containing protein [Maridesulfovibrio ferrireducens]MBI9112858.1 DUF3795 domain-containing protein [Maridesulfovibrio ferrireducens]